MRGGRPAAPRRSRGENLATAAALGYASGMGFERLVVGALCVGLAWSSVAEAAPHARVTPRGSSPAPKARAADARSTRRAPTKNDHGKTEKHGKVAKGRAKADERKARLEKAAVRIDKAGKAEPATTSWFLAANPHVPLAVVRGGELQAAVPRTQFGTSCGDKRRWASEGSSWRALDAWGRFVGTATVDVVEDYDVTKCGEVYFAPKFDRTNTMLFVSSDSAYAPGPSFEWAAGANAQGTFLALLGKVAAPAKRKAPFTCTEITKGARFFQVGGQKLAVGGSDGGFLVAAFDGRTWTTERTERGSDEMRTCYRPVGVMDLNGDGKPEIVVRQVFGDGEGWHDAVLTRDGSGHWSLVAVSPGGSTA